ncbi:uncharacterized protein [Callorhinus ursinus]|uniref:uncharacterized protein n=1 Tax=Callorhinus ursinus TaxID=34884 RepID=UPI003CD03865
MEPTETELEAEKPGAGCLWVCGDGSRLAPQGGAPRGWCGARSKDCVQSTQRVDCSRGDVPGRAPSWLRLLWEALGWALSCKYPRRAGTGVSFSPLTDVPRPKELEPAPTPSAALQGGVVPAEASAGDQEPAVDPAPAHGEPDADQEGPAGEPVPGEPAPFPATVPAGAGAPVPAPNCGPAPAPDPAPALDPDPSLPLPVPLSLPLTQILPWFLYVPLLQTLSLPLHLPLPLPLLVLLFWPLTQVLPLPLPMPVSLFSPLTQILPPLMSLPLPVPLLEPMALPLPLLVPLQLPLPQHLPVHLFLPLLRILT